MTIYSYSRLKCYELCLRKYKYRYIDKIRTKVKENIELFLGRRVHETLEKLYLDLMHQKKNTLGDLLGFLHDEWNKNWNDSIRIIKTKYSPKDYLKISEQYISDYYNRYKPFNHGRTIGLEKRIFMDLDDSGDYKLCGYIDRVTKTREGCYEIHDYKTSPHLPTSEDIRNDRQLALYAMIVKQRYPYVRNIKLVWHFLKYDMELVSAQTDEELKRLKLDTIRLIDEIENVKEFSTNPSQLCDWCEFKTICK